MHAIISSRYCSIQRGSAKKLDRRDVELRIADWQDRICVLYSNVESWLSESAELNFTRTPSVQMHEELMRSFNISAIALDCLHVWKHKKLLATFKPVALWVIGANGRIDILTVKGAYMLIDQAAKFTPPQWVVFEPDGSTKPTAFDVNLVKKLVS